MKRHLPASPILLPCPVLVIGSYDAQKRPNVMTASWAGIVASRPPCISVSLREATTSFHNIRQAGAFTVNVPSEKDLIPVDAVGIISGQQKDKFALAHWTSVPSTLVNAPLVEEFPYALECQLLQEIPLGSHSMFVGEIKGIYASEDCLGINQLPDLEKVRPILYGSFGSNCYYGHGEKLGTAFAVGKSII